MQLVGGVDEIDSIPSLRHLGSEVGIISRADLLTSMRDNNLHAYMSPTVAHNTNTLDVCMNLRFVV